MAVNARRKTVRVGYGLFLKWRGYVKRGITMATYPVLNIDEQYGNAQAIVRRDLLGLTDD
jgi:hypothetical protein